MKYKIGQIIYKRNLSHYWRGEPVYFYTELTVIEANDLYFMVIQDGKGIMVDYTDRQYVDKKPETN